MVTRDQAKQYFLTGKFPNQAQFWALLESILFSGEVSMADIAGLAAALQGKADKAAFEQFYSGLLIVTANSGEYELQIPAKYLVEKLVLIPYADCTARIGSFTGGQDILPNTEFSTNGTSVELNYLALAQQSLFINGLPTSSKIIVFQRPVKTQ